MRGTRWADAGVAVLGVLVGMAVVLTFVPGRSDAEAVVLGAVAEREPTPAQLRAALGSTVGVTQDGCLPRRGSGVVLANGLVLTAGHVLDGSADFQMVDALGGATDSGAAQRSEWVDVATGAAPDGFSGVEWAAADPAPGQLVAVGSADQGGAVSVRMATVEGARRGTGRLDPSTAVRLSVPASPGDSGGPVLDDDGRLVGMVYAAEIGTGRALVIPVSILREALGDLVAAPAVC